MMIDSFKTPFQTNIDKENRWVKLAGLLPWDAMATIYYRAMSSDMGAPAIDARIVIGAMIIKHKLKLDDRETIETIRENPYMQYFLGLSQYTNEPVFDRSLFTTLPCFWTITLNRSDKLSSGLLLWHLLLICP